MEYILIIRQVMANTGRKRSPIEQRIPIVIGTEPFMVRNHSIDTLAMPETNRMSSQIETMERDNLYQLALYNLYNDKPNHLNRIDDSFEMSQL